MSAYRILEDGNRINEIKTTEGTCPVCGDVRFSEYYEKGFVKYKGKPARQFRYRCRRCQTQWEGEIYSSDFTKCLSTKK